MSWIEIQDEQSWEEKVHTVAWTPFLQSWAWGEFQKSCGREVIRLVWQDQGIWKMAAQFVRYRHSGLSYWLAPRGPFFASVDRRENIEVLRTAFLHLPRELSGMFLFTRLEPLMEAGMENKLSHTWHRRPALNPSTTFLTDLQQDGSALQAAMHSKTRYNIRVAEKNGVQVREGVSEQDFDQFWKLTEDTARRDGFLPQSKVYLLRLWQTLFPLGMARIRLAEWQGRALAANLEIVYGDTVTYLHGASSSEERQVMAPYALHWAAMMTAKAEGKRWYDWWGCNPEDPTAFDFKSSWEGITRFKLGWGGERRNLIGSWDIPRYPWMYKIFSRYRGWK